MHTTTRVQAPISYPVVSPTPSFDVRLDMADFEFLKRNCEECKPKLATALENVKGENPYDKVFAALQQALGEGSRTAQTEHLRKQLRVDREKGLLVGSH